MSGCWSAPLPPLRSSWNISRMLVCASPAKRTRRRLADDAPHGCIELLAENNAGRSTDKRPALNLPSRAR